MKTVKIFHMLLLLVMILSVAAYSSHAWFDETHLAVAKVTGYHKWFNSAGTDVARIKLGDKEGQS
jgi:hypothetical protein